jgi:hypothetical protein
MGEAELVGAQFVPALSGVCETTAGFVSLAGGRAALVHANGSRWSEITSAMTPRPLATLASAMIRCLMTTRLLL